MPRSLFCACPGQALSTSFGLALSAGLCALCISLWISYSQSYAHCWHKVPWVHLGVPPPTHQTNLHYDWGYFCPGQRFCQPYYDWACFCPGMGLRLIVYLPGSDLVLLSLSQYFPEKFSGFLDLFCSPPLGKPIISPSQSDLMKTEKSSGKHDLGLKGVHPRHNAPILAPHSLPQQSNTNDAYVALL